MPGRPTIRDVARAAGVSATTVDRALNGRGTVREDTMRSIAEAAHRLGYHGKGVIADRLNRSLPELRLGFVLLKKSQEFYRTFAARIEAEVARRTEARIVTDIRFAASQSPDEFAAIIAELGQRCDAIGCVAVNDRRLDPVVQRLRDEGVAVFSVLNDFAQGIRRGYVGLNNMKIGRVAAWMVSRTVQQPGKLAIFVGGNRWHGHDLREVGFRSLVREVDRGFSVLDTRVNLETRQVTYEATLDLIDRHPDLRGLYVAGGGMEGAIAALREAHARPHLSLVVNELTTESRSALIDGYVTMVVSTPLEEMCRKLLDLMVASTSEAGDEKTSQHFLDPRIILSETL